MNEGNELGRIIWTTSQDDEATISATGANIVADAILAAGYRRPRTITTVEELDALPVGSIVLDSGRDVCERMSFGWFGIVKEEGADPWLLAGAEDVPLPATVLYEPEATK